MAVEAAQAGMRIDGDRDNTAARLLKSSAEKYFDPEIEIDWDAPWEDGKRFLSAERTSLFGTRLWDTLTTEEQVELGKHELASVLIVGIYAEAVLGTWLYRYLMGSKLTDNEARFYLTQIGEETRHSVMFGRLVDKMVPNPLRVPSFVVKPFVFATSMIPTGPITRIITLVLEQVLDQTQRAVMSDPEIQPHVRQLMRIHVIEEARHITFEREEIVRSMDDSNSLVRLLARIAMAATALVVPVIFPNPLSYRAIGISPLKGFVHFYSSKRYREYAQFLFEATTRFAYDAGMIRGFLPKLLWRLSRTLPDDIAAELASGVRKEPVLVTEAAARRRGRAL